MKLYVKAYSSYQGDVYDFDIKEELKSKYKLDTRRQDTFIHLAVYGAQLLKERTTLCSSDELYITSGVGNIDVLQKIHHYIGMEKEFIKPFDFINILGNTTSYYVASSLGIKDKNSFQISNHFTFLRSLISIYASLKISKKDAILGSLDLCTQPDGIIKRVLGVSEDTQILSSVNYQKLSLSSVDALAAIEFDTKTYSLQEIREILQETSLRYVVSMRCKGLDPKEETHYFETIPSSFINDAIQKKESLLYIDCFGDSYKIIKLIIS